MELKASVEITLLMKDGETFEEAENRLYDLLYDGLCRNAEAEMEFYIYHTA
jgi:hypothetical protein